MKRTASNFFSKPKKRKRDNEEEKIEEDENQHVKKRKIEPEDEPVDVEKGVHVIPPFVTIDLKDKEHPWQIGESVPYLNLVTAFTAIGETRKRLEHISILRKFFIDVIMLSSQDLAACVYLSTCEVAPPFEKMELGIGDSILMKGISQSVGIDLKTVRSDYKKLGDLGLVTSNRSIKTVRLFQPKPLTAASVFDKLVEIARVSGKNSVQRRLDIMRNLLTACRENESLFIIRSLQGKLRINMGPKTVLTALAQAFACVQQKRPSPERLNEAGDLVEEAYNSQPNWNKIIQIVFEHGLDQLPEKCGVVTGVPVAPMLAQPSKSMNEILKRIGTNEFTAEWKYDGERSQVHYNEGTFHIFTRNMDDATERYPDVTARFTDSFSKDRVSSAIVDCETVAFNVETNEILPFQVLSTRGRKNVDAGDISVQVCLFAFDLIYLNGESLIHKPLRERRDLLKEYFTEIPGFFVFATHRDFKSLDGLEDYLQESVEGKTEGLMVKLLDHDADYKLSKRSFTWLKMKKDYLDNGMADSLDLVPVGAWHGKGKRTGVYGGYLLATYDEDTEQFLTVCKTGTGFSDKDLAQLTKDLKEISHQKQYVQVPKALMPDIWIDPVVVWEVRTADLSLSPLHTSGISLRFPRFVRARPDKKPEEATSPEQITQMYYNQDNITKTNNTGFHGPPQR